MPDTPSFVGHPARVGRIASVLGLLLGLVTCEDEPRSCDLYGEAYPHDARYGAGCNSCQCFDGGWQCTEKARFWPLSPDEGLCFPICVHPTAPPICHATYEPPTGQSARIHDCEIDNSGWRIPDGDDMCVTWRTDRSGQTATPADDQSAECLATDYSLEVRLHLRDGVETLDGARYDVSCYEDYDKGLLLPLEACECESC